MYMVTLQDSIEPGLHSDYYGGRILTQVLHTPDHHTARVAKVHSR